MFKEKKLFFSKLSESYELMQGIKGERATMLGDTEIWLQKFHGSIMFAGWRLAFPKGLTGL